MVEIKLYGHLKIFIVEEMLEGILYMTFKGRDFGFCL